MSSYRSLESHWADPVVRLFLKAAASGWFPARWFQPSPPDAAARAAKTGPLRIEIVSHCWRYAHLLAHQLGSLVRFRPEHARVTMTVFHAPADTDTRALLEHVGAIDIPGVEWNWRPLEERWLFRRAVGRNLAARETQADWVWFTDCDLMFRNRCLDELNEALQGRNDVLVYPRQERVTPLLEDGDDLIGLPVFSELDPGSFIVPDVDPDLFHVSERGRATGPLQITHGDVARACGYCDALGFYQRPAPSFCKATEDKAFRWLLRTQGTPVDVAGVYRIRHATKGRYSGSRFGGGLRERTRRIQSWFRDRERP